MCAVEVFICMYVVEEYIWMYVNAFLFMYMQKVFLMYVLEVFICVCVCC